MKKLIGRWMLALSVVSIGVLLIGGLAAALKKDGWNSGNAASWAQAISSVVAIVAAVLIMTKQHREDERTRARDDAKMQLRLLLSLRTELAAKRTAYIAKAGAAVERTKKGDIFDYVYWFVPDQFYVFDSHVNQIGLVESDVLRELIITGFSTFKNLIFVIELNSNLMEKVNAEAYNSGGNLPDERREIYGEQLEDMTDQIIYLHQRSLDLSGKILERLSDDALHDLIQRAR